MESDCHDDSPHCRCPCDCGCQNDPNGMCLPFDEKGMCAACSKGQHELPPETVIKLDDLISMHENIIAYYKSVRENRKKD